MADSFGPTGWFKWSEVNLMEDAISWIEEDSIWMFLFVKIHNPSTGRVEKGRINPRSTFLWDQFRAESCSRRPLAKLKDHFEKVMSPNLHNSKMTGETKLKFYFALDIPVNEAFLKRLLERKATVLLNENRCIFRFRQNTPGGLELISFNLSSSTAKKRKSQSIVGQEDVVWEYLYKRIHNPHTGEILSGKVVTTDLKFWKAFKDDTDFSDSTTNLMIHFHTAMAPFLHLTSYKTQEKVELYFALEIPVDETYLKCLEKTADVMLDCKRCIVVYEEKMDGGLKLSATNGKSTSSGQIVPFTAHEDGEMWKFVYDKIIDSETRKVKNDNIQWKSFELWKDFKPKRMPHRHATAYQRRFKNVLIPRLQTMNLDFRMKVSIYFGLRLPVNMEFLKKMEENADVVLNEDGSIESYKEKKKRPQYMNTGNKSELTKEVDWTSGK